MKNNFYKLLFFIIKIYKNLQQILTILQHIIPHIFVNETILLLHKNVFYNLLYIIINFMSVFLLKKYFYKSMQKKIKTF